MKTPWPKPIPAWFWPWARWRLGRGEFKGHANDPKKRPKDTPDRIPFWAWARLAVMVGKPVPKPKPPPVNHELDKARELLKWAKGFTGPYDFGGGHGVPLSTLNRAMGLDCSSSTSLLFWQFDMLGQQYAMVSGQFEKWGRYGRGKYVTVHANAEHVWVEFALPEGWWRLDTSPHGDGERGPRVRTGRRSDRRFVHRHPAGM